MKLGMRRIARTDLPRGEAVIVTDGQATTVRVDRGTVWITEEGSHIDHILTAGQRYAFDRPGAAIVSAHTDARVTLMASRFAGWPARIATARTTLYARPLWRSIVAWVLPVLSPAGPGR